MKVSRKKSRSKIWAFIFAVAMVVSLFAGFGKGEGSTARAAAGDPPVVSKAVEANPDGTYTLSLSITGDADPDVEAEGDVNILIVYDVSSSMTSNNVTTNPNRNRGDYAEDVVHDFIEDLRQLTVQDPNLNIEVAVVTFAVTGQQRQTWTTNLTGNNTGANRFFDDGVDGTVTQSYTGNGTNWESALIQAQGYLNTLDQRGDEDPTFVVLVTDGACTASGNGNNAINPAGNRPWTDFRPFYNEARNEARAIESRANTSLYGIYAYGREADLLDDLVYYGQNGSDRPGMNGETVADTEHYFNANDTASLKAAVTSIFEEIVNALGISSVNISDGTTSRVEASSGEVSHLLDVDQNPDNYEYWLTVPVVGGKFTRTDVHNNEIEYTVNAGSELGDCTVSWTDADGGNHSVNLTGYFETNTRFTYRWTEANDLYNVAPPAASYNSSTGAVEWNLEPANTLLDGVTYTVKFAVWPSQETLDMVADLENGHPYDEVVPAEAQPYLSADGALRTNTNSASASYTDTRTGESGTVDFNQVDPVSTNSSELLTVTKEWENDLDSQGAEAINLNVMRGDAVCHTVTLSDGHWSDTVHISIGLMSVQGDSVVMHTTGHDYTFAEPTEIQHNWQINAPVVHPMLINNDTQPTMLVLVEDEDELATLPAAPASGSAKATVGSDTYYYLEGFGWYKVDAAEGSVSLTAVNERRSQLVIQKTVTGNAPEDTLFNFTATVTDEFSPDGEVWFLLSDGTTTIENGNDTYIEADGLTIQRDGDTGDVYYHVESGTPVTVHMQADWTLRFVNLSDQSSYTVVETDLPEAFTLTDISGLRSYTDEEGAAEEAAGSASGETGWTGTIDNTNSEYQITFTNNYERTSVSVTKVWSDGDDQDGIRPDSIQVELLANGEVEGEPVTLSEENNWTYTWADLPISGIDIPSIEYTVREVTTDVITGEDTESTYAIEVTGDAENGFTITNTHTPAVTSISVSKEWNDADNQDGLRPESVSVQLMADGAACGDPVTLSESNSWAYTWENLPVNTADGEIEYTVEETPVPTGYTAQVSGTAADGFVVTNVHTPGTTTFTVTKVWDDGNDNDQIRPESVTVELYANGAATGETVVLSEENNWTYTWEELPASAGGQAIAYSAQETEVPEGYEAAVETDESSSVITNTHETEVTTLEIVKVWADGNDQDGIRPETITVTVTGTVTAAGKGEDESEPAEEATDESGDAEGEDAATDESGAGEDAATDESGSGNDAATDESGAGNDAATDESGAGNDAATDESGAGNDAATDESGAGNDAATDESGANNDGATDESGANNDGATDESGANNDGTAGESEPSLNGAEDETGTIETSVIEETPVIEETGTIEAAVPETPANDLYRKVDAPEEGDVVYTREVTLSAENNWRIVLDDLPRFADGTEISYTVEEQTVEGYTSEVDYGESVVTITNTHTPAPAPVTVTLTATKVLTGRELVDGEFSFVLTDANGAVFASSTNDAAGVITFTMEFTEPGIYELAMSEVAGSGDNGVTYDQTPYVVTIEVTNQNGVLVANVTNGTGVTFTNTYEADPASVQITARKVLTGRELRADEFSFQLLDEQGNVLQTVKNAANGAIDFAAITYEEAGVYNYTIVEVAGSETGMTYDSTRFGVTVTVTDNGQGSLVATVSYANGTPVFSNIYVPPTPPRVPTGDSSHGAMYAVICLAAALACVSALIARKRAH